MCEDRNGYLWLGTQGGGVCRFDGIGFEVFTVQEGLSSNFITALYEDRHGTLWAGTNEGLAYFDGKRFRKVPLDGRLVVYSFIQADSSRLLIGTSRGVWKYVFKAGQASKVMLNETLDKTPVYSLVYVKQTRTVWLGTLQGLWVVSQQNQQQVVHFNRKNKLPIWPIPALALSGNTLYAAQTEGPLLVADWSKQTLRSSIRHSGLERVTCLLPEPDGTIWAGTTAQGLFRLTTASDSSGTRLTESEGLPHNHVRVLLRDHTGRMWLGTSGGGFACMGAQAFRQYDRGDGLPGNRIYAVQETPNGEIWLAVSQNGLAKVDSAGRIQRITTHFGYLDGVKCRTLAVDKSGNVWAGTEGKGALMMTPAGGHYFRKDNRFLPSDWVQKIVCDAAGTIWLATGAGIVALKQNPADSNFTQKTFGTEAGVPAGSINALQEDPQHNIWFGTASGKVGFIKNDKVEAVFGAAQDLPALPVTALAFDAAGRCWVGTKGAGVFWKNNGRYDPFIKLKTPQPLSSQNIYLLAFDQSGNLWAGTETGVDQIAFEKGQVISVRHFGKQEGFSGIETCQDAGLSDRKGRLWFGTMNGLMRYIPNTVERRTSPPVLHFEEVSLFYKPIGETSFSTLSTALFDGTEGGLHLPWNQNHLSFSFQGIELLHDEPMMYRWKLEGPDKDWSPWTEQAQVNYASLAPGFYRLWVQAAGDPDALSEPVSAVFTIGKPFWETWTFRLAALALLIALAAWGFRSYVQRIKSTEARRREQLEVQNRLLQLEQKALQLQMNPHFIFNAFNSIQSLIATRDYDTARQEINRFAKLMRSILNNSRKSSITLQEEVETLQQYLSVEQFCQQNPFTFAIRVADNVDAENLDIPPMLLQPFVENAVVHGVSHLAYPGHIEVSFDLEDHTLICRIRDNGPGREKAALLREAKKPGHQSAAVAVTQERLAAIGGSLVFRDGETGTEVEIRLNAET